SMSSQRVAVVTGGNRGIGLEVSRQLAAKGLKVVLTARDEDKAKQAAAGLQGDVVPFALDVTDAQAAARLLELGVVDVLINNAGVFIDRDYGGLNLPMEVLRDTLEINLIGPWQLSEAVAPGMRQGGYGRIVNVSSGLGAMSEMSGGYPAYRISKSSLNALTRIF